MATGTGGKGTDDGDSAWQPAADSVACAACGFVNVVNTLPSCDLCDSPLPRPLAAASPPLPPTVAAAVATNLQLLDKVSALVRSLGQHCQPPKASTSLLTKRPAAPPATSQPPPAKRPAPLAASVVTDNAGWHSKRGSVAKQPAGRKPADSATPRTGGAPEAARRSRTGVHVGPTSAAPASAPSVPLSIGSSSITSERAPEQRTYTNEGGFLVQQLGFSRAKGGGWIWADYSAHASLIQCSLDDAHGAKERSFMCTHVYPEEWESLMACTTMSDARLAVRELERRHERSVTLLEVRT